MKKKIPLSSYRLQLSKDFDFAKARKLLPYLQKLGIEMVYTSPYFERVGGTENPYLIVSPLEIAKELGGEEEFILFCKECQRLSIQHMMDIVPNHMAASLENTWWKDVVEKGESSKYAKFFDIFWEEGEGHVVLPGTVGNIHEHINYRRFFDICEMVGINIEEERLYELFFSKIRFFVEEGFVQGFRVDHIDGLKYPKAFLEKVARDFPHLYIALEKIVQDGEEIRENLPCDGSVGYDILFLIDQVLLDKSGEGIFVKLFEENREEEQSLAEMKISYLNHYLPAEVERFAKKLSVPKKALLQFFAHFPIYRTYLDGDTSIDKRDKRAIKEAEAFAGERIFKEEKLEEFLELQQILPGVFAKGFEDTFNYRYCSLASLNEVGGDPLQFSISNEKFHDRIQTIFGLFPATMHTLSTHDTKRSLDARMRLHALAEMDEETKEVFETWRGSIPPFESSFLVYFFFQSFLAISEEDILPRLQNYMIKVMREGKYYSDYLSPDLELEEKMKEWIFFVLEDKKSLAPLLAFKEKVVEVGKLKSLTALALQIALPGVMDLYQGEETDNANLVDPDNRRPVDFPLRKKMFEDSSCKKMNLLKKGLQFRKENRELILHGTYEPLSTSEEQIGFKRVYQGKELTLLINKFPSKKEHRIAPNIPGKISIFGEELPIHLSCS
ncbi:hypothetical protein K0U07_01045 [bacterium]|nr:hypothetical protein [bacterium]